MVLSSLLIAIIGEDSALGTTVKKMVFVLISFAMVSLPLTFLKPKYYSYLILALFPFIVFESNHIILLKTPSSEAAIASLFSTNYDEAKEFILANLLGFFFSFIIACYLLIIVFKIQKEFFIFKLYKKLIFSVFVFTTNRIRCLPRPNQVKQHEIQSKEPFLISLSELLVFLL